MPTRDTEPTYGVELSEGDTTTYHLGSDEILWDWANAPIAVPFVDGLAEVPLPDGYVVLNGEDRLVKGVASLGITDVLVSSKNAFEDKAYVLSCSMSNVSRREFNAAGLSDERIIRSSI